MRSLCSDVYIPDDVSLPRFILDEAAKYGNKTAFADSQTGRSMTFTELIDGVRRVNSALSRRGVAKGDVILIMTPNIVEYPVILYAANYLGAILSTCNPAYTTDELLYQLQDSNARYLITIPEQAAKAKEAVGKYGKVEEMFMVGYSMPGFTPLRTLLQDNGEAFKEAVINPKEDICLLCYSSGTTGRSKGVMLTHQNMIAMVAQISHRDMDVMVPGQEVLIAFLPFFHVFAICVYLTWCIRLGQKTVVLSKFELEKYLQAIQKYRATFLHMVPPIAVLLGKHPLVSNYDVSSVHTVIAGAAPLGQQQAEALMNRLGIKAVRQGYGLTETSAVTHVAPIHGWKHGSIGMLLPNMECKVLDTMNGATLGPDQEGELCMRGPTIMKGYLNNPEATRRTIDEEGWLHSGDVGYYDKDGHFFIVDRVKELVKYKGFQVPPAELESILLSHPGVSDAAVIGVPDEEAGELPRAYVVKRPKTNVTEGDIQRYVTERVAPHKKLRGGVIFISEIPKSASGKILRRQLRDRAKKTTTLKSKL